VAVIQVARNMGVSLAHIGAAFGALPDGRDPTPRDWEHLSKRWRDELNERVAALEKLRDQLSSCIGCGCLSLDRCGLYNTQDRAAAKGPGARYLLGDTPDLSS
jgi:MerR family redox-sensitive transcriptional activator SoxR